MQSEWLVYRHHGREVTYGKGQTIYSPGALCEALDVVVEGHLVATTLAENGSETVVFRFTPGSTVGANLLFGDRHHYPLAIQTLSEVTLLRIPKAKVEGLFQDQAFVMSFIHELSLNAQGLNQKMALLTKKSLRQNILAYLSHLSDKQQSDTVLLPMTKKDMADYFAVERPSLFREFKRLKEEGIIDIEGKKITIKSRMNE